MFSAHFAIALLAIAVFPQAPKIAFIVASILPDLVNCVLVLLGISKVSLNAANGPYLFAEYLNCGWDHSVVTIAAYSLVWSMLFWRKGFSVVLGVFVTGLSHLGLDAAFHDQDISIYPGSAVQIGYGLWSYMGTNAWLLEGGICLLCALVFYLVNRKREVGMIFVCFELIGIFLIVSPWTSPFKFIPSTVETTLGGRIWAIIMLVILILPGLTILYSLQRAHAVPRRKSLQEVQ